MNVLKESTNTVVNKTSIFNLFTSFVQCSVIE